MSLLHLSTPYERLALLRKTARPFRDRATEHDEENSFPFNNIADLRAIDYPAIVLPKTHGGLDISLVELLKMQQTLAEMDGSTALAIGWHMGITQNLGQTDEWSPELFEEFASDVLTNGALINNAASEPATGSPTRGGKPETTATKTENSWIINGRKTFTTLSPVLNYFVVSASITGSDRVANFLVKREYSGLSIDETWNSVAMRATGSHDLVLDHVSLPENAYLYDLEPGNKSPRGWLLHIPAVYHGISIAAFDYALNFANTYAPNSIASGTIAQFPAVQQKLGAMRLKILQNDHFLYGVARKWDESDQETRESLGDELAAVKVAVVENALEIVDLAMRLVGARSLQANNPLQRYYRDIRAGLHNPPMEDAVLISLAKSALNSHRDNRLNHPKGDHYVI